MPRRDAPPHCSALPIKMPPPRKLTPALTARAAFTPLQPNQAQTIKPRRIALLCLSQQLAKPAMKVREWRAEAVFRKKFVAESGKVTASQAAGAQCEETGKAAA